MLEVRVIPCLLLGNNGLVKTTKFRDPAYIGDPINAVRIFNDKEVDEIIFLDITRTPENGKPDFRMIEEISNECFIPFCYGGGIRDIETMKAIFKLGAEKISLNTAAFENPELVRKAADIFGSQSIVISIDVLKSWTGQSQVVTNCGKKATGVNPVDYAVMMQKAGAGELLVNSINKDGTQTGYDLELLKEITKHVNIPVIGCGGAGKLEHLKEAVDYSRVSGVAAGSLFIYFGNKKGVLINYPERPTLEKLFDMSKNHQVCSRCVMDSSVPEIVFDDSGVCNYCRQFDAIINDCPNDDKGQEYINVLFENIKKEGRKNKYDVVVGVSGGVDSTYLVHLAAKSGLRVLAVNCDNGWHSEIAVSNIKNCLEKLGIDLITYVVDYGEMKDILLSYMKAGLPWVDGPSDLAINATLFKIASQNRIKYIFNGSSIRTEGKQPDAWTHTDSRQANFIQKKFGKLKLKSFPNFSPFQLLYFGYFRNIKMVRPFNYIKYSKADAKVLLEKEYGWKDYGGHHHESAFTKFVIADWLPRKFGIDKRKITFSAQVRSGLLDRRKALQLLAEPPYDPAQMDEDRNYIIKKLGISESEFINLWKAPNKSIFDYPSYLPLFNRYAKYAIRALKYVLPFKPMVSYELEKRKS